MKISTHRSSMTAIPNERIQKNLSKFPDKRPHVAKDKFSPRREGFFRREQALDCIVTGSFANIQPTLANQPETNVFFLFQLVDRRRQRMESIFRHVAGIIPPFPSPFFSLWFHRRVSYRWLQLTFRSRRVRGEKG